MKALLLHRDRDFDLQRELPADAQALTQDLELDTIFDAMAGDDEFLSKVVRRVILSSLDSDLDTIRYRQQVLGDCLQNPAVIRDIYEIAVEAIAGEKKVYFGFLSDYPDAILRRSVEVLRMFVDKLKKLRSIADEHADDFESEGLKTFFAMLEKELDDEYFATVQHHLRELKFPHGVLISAELGKGNKGADYVLRKPLAEKRNWLERLFARKAPTYTFYIAERDQNGARALSELRDRGINLVANALAQSTDHILGFFSALRTELAFYVACLNLHEQLSGKGEPLSFPLPVALGEHRHSFSGLYDICLALNVKQRVVGNDGNADGKNLVIITGANQGGKTTFLRSVGLAQLMMQSGMFVAAESFSANICDGLFTHFKREEDATMESGKLDEELGRMSAIVDDITPNSMVLFNESFAATNEREGSEIASQISSALLEERIKCFFVTHLYEFANGFYQRKLANVMFLRAERRVDGTRTFRLVAGKPLATGYGEDLYESLFGGNRFVEQGMDASGPDERQAVH